MAGPPRAVAEVRRAVRDGLRGDDRPVLAACSGGADSVALAAALAFEARAAGARVGAVTVDHGLQAGSAARAESTAALLRGLGLAPVLVLTVRVGDDGGPEGAARTARHAVLATAAREHGARIALGHTLDDQAETVLLGLGRGSGPRSVAGMVPERAADGVAWWRPLLGIRRATTRQACADQGLPVWDDPWNADPAYTRVRLRTQALPLLEEVLGGGVAPALARTAELLREDLDALDALAAAELARLAAGCGDGGLPAKPLAALPAALRRRVLRGWLSGSGVPDLQAVHLRAVESLVTGWRGQGTVHLPGGAGVVRASGTLVLLPPGDRRGTPGPAPHEELTP
ncbi:tRNA lysidine(34) synthetase TilS [Blastococcus sp. MG754426]|uniref:tRNA lysidine(34) synthetase TilS n=1 Tax=unclassified Blastococcus TaxID=2619396 RepID=UPI001EEFAD27|nr:MULTISPECIES: tRNA lysidine(34) synthetase TilS [unclassified Blastococcus]MCF6506234.1 tRNA lysidine(34) synthetase TilS [Blastococcus sp. MG754426]MCF6510388.1 tRNA lysidine(34) synthetase TilS [Blastococcus sp. MG754427]